MLEAKVKEIIADVLYLDVDAISTDSNLMRDLGAESIDFLDIIFRLEQEFSVTLPRGEIERRAKDGLTDDEFAVGGLIQERGLESLKRLMPEVDPAEFKAGLYVRDIPSLFTVRSFARMIQEQLGQASQAGASQGLEASAGV